MRSMAVSPSQSRSVSFAPSQLVSGCGQGASPSCCFQEAEGCGCSAHVVITLGSRGDVMAHSRSAAKKILEFAAALAVALCGYIHLASRYGDGKAEEVVARHFQAGSRVKSE